MDDFYVNQLGSNPYILNTVVISYHSDEFEENLALYDTQTLTQYVFALDAMEAEANASKFRWDKTEGFIDSPDLYAYDFWISAGVYNGYGRGVSSYNEGWLNTMGDGEGAGGAGARPAFWISLD